VHLTVDSKLKLVQIVYNIRVTLDYFAMTAAVCWKKVNLDAITKQQSLVNTQALFCQ